MWRTNYLSYQQQDQLPLKVDVLFSNEGWLSANVTRLFFHELENNLWAECRSDEQIRNQTLGESLPIFSPRIMPHLS